ncbi:hypothetical protein M5689_012708 [Euphorbia peplus]|nr:hypothetical protein M5689_012708 [Euphorbia peplus]
MASFHQRSISLPSISHPLIISIKEQLCNLKALDSLSTPQKLNGLKNLFECVDDFLQLPISQKILSHGKDALNGSLHILDICDTVRDLFAQMKENVKELELSLRRRKGNSSFTAEVEAFMISRKNLNKVICKFQRNLRNKGRILSEASMENKSLDMLTSVEETSVTVFESILSIISQPKSSTWSIVSKLLQSKDETEATEMKKIEQELLVLKSSKDIKHEHVQNLVKGLKEMESSFQQVEEELECVYRQLLKTRVSLLNILNN